MTALLEGNVDAASAVRNVGRFVADAFLSYGALLARDRRSVPGDDELRRLHMTMGGRWRRVADIQVTAESERAATVARLYDPLLSMLGYERSPERVEIEIEPERVSTGAYRDGADNHKLLVEMLPYGRRPDDRYTEGPFRGTAQRKMERMLSASGAPFGLILGGPRWRLVALDAAQEPRYLEFDLERMLGESDLEAFRVFASLVRPAALLDGEVGLVARLIAESDELGTSVGEELGPATREALRVLLEGVRTDEANAGWAPEFFTDPEGLRKIHEEGIYVLYRLLFVLYAEAMGALPIESPLYREAYSLERLRGGLDHLEDFAASRYAMWDGLRALFRLIDRGALTDEFRIPTYNGGLFAPERTPKLNAARVNDAVIARMLRSLTTVEVKIGGKRTRDRVSFRELGVAQLGAVFESLLDYEPHIASENLFEATVGTGKNEGVSYLPTETFARVAGANGRRRAGRGRTKQGAAELPEPEKPKPAVLKGSFYLQAWGGQRKSTGAYYTPQVIADYLVREALGPQVVGRSSQEILQLTVCDPAMGSGGFLVASTRFLGDSYYEALVGEGRCDPEDPNADRDRKAAWRTVAEHCVYGVDLNPLAVELAKVSLWLTTLAYDRPLSFFDHHLRRGNSLLGAPLRDTAGAITADRIAVIPKEALADVDSEATSEEKKLLKTARERNAAELKHAQRGQLSLFSSLDLQGPLHEYAQARADLSLEDPTESAAAAAERNRWKERRLRELTSDPGSRFFRLREMCDLWMAPWFWPHDTDVNAPSTEEYRQAAAELWEHGSAVTPRSGAIVAVSESVARGRRFFHWELEFPEVFERGGFSAFVGNPPWETLVVQTREFFTNFDPLFRNLKGTPASRRQRELLREASVSAAFSSYSRAIKQLIHFARNSGCYRWFAKGNIGKGKTNYLFLFMERDFLGLAAHGRVAQVVQDSFYIAPNGSEARRRLLADGSVERLIVIENRKKLFPIHSSVKVTLLTASRGAPKDVVPMAFFVGKNAALNERSLSLRELVRVLGNPDAHSTPISVDFIRRMSPKTLSFLEIVDRKDAQVLEWLSSHGIRFEEAWEPAYCQELNATGDSDLFRDAAWLEAHGAIHDGWNWMHPKLGEFWPLVEGRNIYQFEFPVGEFNKWVNAREGITRVPKAPDGKPVNLHPRLAWRQNASPTNERSMIAAVVPPKVFCKHSLLTFRGGMLNNRTLNQVASLVNSFLFDWQIRARAGTNLTYTLVEQVFVPGPLASLGIARQDDRIEQECAVLSAFQLRFELAEHLFTQFPLLDRRMPALEGEPRSTVTRDLVLAQYAESLGHEKASFYRDRANRAQALGARSFVPATRDEAESIEEEDETEPVSP